MNYVIFFYENHMNSIPSKIMGKLIERFTDINVKAFAIENPNDSNTNVIEFLTSSLKATELRITIIEEQIQESNDPQWLMECITYIVNTSDFLDKENIISSAEELDLLQLKELANSLVYKAFRTELLCEKVTTEVAIRCQHNGIKVFNMDLPTAQRSGEEHQSLSEQEQIKQRNEYMCRSIINMANEQVGGVVVLVGASHQEIANMIRNNQEMCSQYIVKEYFLDNQTGEQLDYRDRSWCDRLKGFKEYNGLYINTADNLDDNDDTLLDKYVNCISSNIYQLPPNQSVSSFFSESQSKNTQLTGEQEDVKAPGHNDYEKAYQTQETREINEPEEHITQLREAESLVGSTHSVIVGEIVEI